MRLGIRLRGVRSGWRPSTVENVARLWPRDENRELVFAGWAMPAYRLQLRVSAYIPLSLDATHISRTL